MLKQNLLWPSYIALEKVSIPGFLHRPVMSTLFCAVIWPLTLHTQLLFLSEELSLLLVGRLSVKWLHSFYPHQI